MYLNILFGARFRADLQLRLIVFTTIAIGIILFATRQIRYTVAPPDLEQIEHLIVNVEQGQLRGRESVAKYSRKVYCSFLGIPYAKPPVDELRFMPPQPCEPWDGLYDATYERSQSKQFNSLFYLPMGSEDCLYMNIYTPKPPKEIRDPLPVLFVVHSSGSNIMSGSRAFYGADFLINHDIIVVTFNYRLQIFGFLNLGIKECPGNVGIKDIIFAMQWVNRNISNFGGNPNNVTLFGNMVSADLVYYIRVSPLAGGLFSKFIFSGCTTPMYVERGNPIEKAFIIGEKAGYVGTDRLELVQHLRKLSCSELHRVAMDYENEMTNKKPTKMFAFGPSIEEIEEGAVIPLNFKELAKNITPMPTIIGNTSSEGTFYFLTCVRKNLPRCLGRDCMKILKDNFRMNPELYPGVEKELRRIYFGDKEVCNSTISELLDLFRDLLEYERPEIIESTINSGAPTYLYSFDYEGRLNAPTLNFMIWYPWLRIINKLKGCSAADEQQYLFNVKLMVYPPVSEENLKIIDFFSTSIANFAKTGNPSTSTVEWRPATQKEICHLSIDEKLEMKPENIGSKKISRLRQLLDPFVQEIL